MDTDSGLSCCHAVQAELRKVSNKLREAEQEASNLDQAISFLESVKQQTESCGETFSDDTAMTVHQGIVQTNSTCSKIAKSHKDIHSVISKFGKSIDKNFTADYSTILTTKSKEIEGHINKCIAQHLLREGQYDVAESLIKEANLCIDEEMKAPFFELNAIVTALQQRDLNPAFRWVNDHRLALEEQGSQLELRLHRLRYIQLLSAGRQHQHEALAYIRSVAASQKAATAAHLQVLMAALMYVDRGLENSPYSRLLEPSEWQTASELFIRDYCALLQLPLNSPLAVSVRVGCAAVSPLLSIRHVLKQNECHGVWRSDDELPIEINTGAGAQFHSMFACPILRQRSSHNNPPMRLSCGHVISRDAVTRLSSMNRIKCPYCPHEMSISDCRQLHF